MYKIVCETESALTSTLPHCLYLAQKIKDTQLHLKVEEPSSKFVNEGTRRDMNEGQTKDYAP